MTTTRATQGSFWTVMTLAAALLAPACSSGDSKTLTPSSGSGGDTSAPSGDGTLAATGNGDPTAGASYVAARNCAKCHNADLAGSTVPLPGYDSTVELYAPNLTPDPDTGLGKWSVAQLALAIRDGIDDTGEVLCPQMQHYATMGDQELNAIIAYMQKQLPAVKKTIPGSICPPLKTKP